MTRAVIGLTQHPAPAPDTTGVTLALSTFMRITRLPKVAILSAFLTIAVSAFFADAATSEPTAAKAQNNQGDVCISRELRERMMKDPQLSMTARSIKLYTSSGVVKLRGKVIHRDERARIIAAAKSIAGVRGVDDKLEILMVSSN